jgi:hypothetical protein
MPAFPAGSDSALVDDGRKRLRETAVERGLRLPLAPAVTDAFAARLRAESCVLLPAIFSRSS